MYCRNCGSPIKEGARYCTKCGAKVNKGKIHSKKNFLIIGIILVILLACLIGTAVIYMHYQNRNSIIGKWTAYSLVNTETGEEITIESLLEDEWAGQFENDEPIFTIEFLEDQTFQIQNADESGEGTWQKEEGSESVTLFVPSHNTKEAENGEVKEWGTAKIVDGYLEFTEANLDIRIVKFERE